MFRENAEARDPMMVLATDRLVLRELTSDDAAFILELLNEPGWLRFIGDRNARTLADVDLGFALLGRFAGQGYATECAAATVAHARQVVGLKRLAAITSPANTASIRVLEKNGLRFERMIRLAPGAEELRYFAIDF